MAFDVPAVLYKYTTAETATKILTSGRLRWSSPVHFNDRAEFKRIPRFEPPLSEAAPQMLELILEAARGGSPFDEQRLSKRAILLLNLARQALTAGTDVEQLRAKLMAVLNVKDQSLSDSLRATFSSWINEARVLCLTETWSNEAMWAHYAQQGTGCVLAFQHVPELDTPLAAAKPVRYSEAPPAIGSGLDVLLYGNTEGLRRAIYDGVVYSKKHYWATEKEWRVVTWSDSATSYTDTPFWPQELESITLGPESETSLAANIMDLASARYPRAVVYRATMNGEALIRTPLTGRSSTTR